MTITNTDVIRAWSTWSQQAIEEFGDEGDAARRYLLNPALWELMGDVAGLKVLDAGCGTGYLARLLARRGARVTGVEPAEPQLRYCVERERAEPLGITYLRHDLSTLQVERQFALVVCNMVLIDIPDWTAAMQTCMAALVPGGRFVFSLLHPCFDEIDSPDFAPTYRAKGYVRVDEYFAPFTTRQPYGTHFHRPLGAYLEEVLKHGGTIERIVEPRLDAAGIAALGADDRNNHVPNFIVISARRG